MPHIEGRSGGGSGKVHVFTAGVGDIAAPGNRVYRAPLQHPRVMSSRREKLR